MNTHKKWFTFVELIVVLVIISILSTIGFTMYEDYLGTWRDTKRIVTLWELQKSMSEYVLRSELPKPQNSIDITASWAVFSWQWDATESLTNTIEYKGEIYDDKLEIYPTYMLAKDKKSFQLMIYLEDPALQNQIAKFSNKVWALDDLSYQTLFPKSFWVPLGILLDNETQLPLHKIEKYNSVWNYDVILWTWSIRAYMEDTNYLISTRAPLIQLIPNHSCKRILELWKSKGDGYYIISPDGNQKLEVYCDMITDGWGWTLIARSVKDASYTGDFWWLSKVGSPKNNNFPYSLWPSIKNMYFTQMTFWVYDIWKKYRKFQTWRDEDFLQWTIESRTQVALNKWTRYIAAKYLISDNYLQELKNESSTPISLPNAVAKYTTLEQNNFICQSSACWYLYSWNFPYTSWYMLGRSSSQNNYLRYNTFGGWRNSTYDNIFTWYPGMIFVR